MRRQLAPLFFALLVVGASTPSRAQERVLDQANLDINRESARRLAALEGQLQALIDQQAPHLLPLLQSVRTTLRADLAAVTTMVATLRDTASTAALEKGTLSPAAIAVLLHDALSAQDLVQGLHHDIARLQAMLGASGDAVGHLQALQAGNALQGMVIHQLMRQEVITAASARAVTAFLATLAHTEARARDRAAQLMKGFPQ